MATKINVWREAGRLLGDYRIATLTDDSPARYAFDDSWDRVIEYVLRQAYWKFALKTTELTDISSVDPVPGYTFVYDLPCDWLRTHALFQIGPGSALECPVDAKHQLEQIHLNTNPVYIRYISDDYADPDTWTEHFAFAVAVRLAMECAERITGNPGRAEQMQAKWAEAMQLAVIPDSLPENPWLRYQLDGSMLAGSRWLLDQAYWRFAVKTVSLTGNTSNVSVGYDYAADKPDDFGRLFHYYSPVGKTWMDIDFRDEDSRFHSDYQSTVLRYVSTDGEDSLTWSDGFRRALLAYLQFQEVKDNPQVPGAVLQARAMAWQEAFKNARLKDDLTEKPRMNNTGLLVQSRSGYRMGRASRSAGGWGW